VNGPRPPTTKRQAIRKGSLQSLVDSVAGVFSDTDTRGASKVDRHWISGSTSRPIRPTLNPSYSAITVGSTSKASYNSPTAASRARSALDMHDRYGAAFSDREGLGFGVLSPVQKRWVVPTTRPNTPTQNTAAVRLQGFMRPAPTPARPIVKNMFLNASTTSNSSTGSTWSSAAIAPSKSAPAPVRSFAAIVKSPPLPSPRVTSPTAMNPGKRLWTMSSLANAKVTFPLPAGAVEVKRPRRPRAPSGIWGDGTELDALDDLDVDPTQERQFQVQAKGVNEGGTVKWFDGKGKARAAPVSTRITNPNGSPNGNVSTDGRVDLSKFKEPDLPKKRERERKPFITLHPPPAATGSALLQVPGRTSNPKRKRERAPPPPKRPNLIRNMNEVKSPKGVWLYLTPLGFDQLILAYPVVGDMSFNPRTLRWDGNEQVLRDFDAAVASSSRPALITNLSGQGPSTPVNGQSSATTPKVVGSMLFDPVNMCWVHQLGDAFEEDPFASIDELDEGEGWGTIKVNHPPSELGTSVGSLPGPIHRLRTEPSPARSLGRARANTHHTQSTSELESVGGSDRGSRMYSREEHERLASGDIDEWDVSDDLLRQCREAEERHKAEVKGWVLPHARGPSQSVAAVVGFRDDRTDRGWLHEIRAVAMKTYPKTYPT